MRSGRRPRRSRPLKIVLDTTYVLGRGAVKDTYNLLADGIIKLARELAAGASCSDPEGWAREHGLGRYFGSSVKGEAGIDWDDPEAREEFLRGVVAGADGLLEMARAALAHIPSGDPERGRLHEAAVLLERIGQRRGELMVVMAKLVCWASRYSFFVQYVTLLRAA